jgi:hypothetical protein
LDLDARNSARTSSNVFGFPAPASNCQNVHPLVPILRPVTVERAYSAAIEHVVSNCPPNPIEPKWAHGKKAVVEPERLLAAAEVRARACDYGCEHLEPLTQLFA